MAEVKKKGVSTKRAFIFFNCDENKSEQSMNIFYNHIVYKDTQACGIIDIGEIIKGEKI